MGPELLIDKGNLNNLLTQSKLSYEPHVTHPITRVATSKYDALLGEYGESKNLVYSVFQLLSFIDDEQL